MIHRALVPGTFDPVTLGHMNLVHRALEMFDEVTICIFHNAAKMRHCFTVEQRLALLRAACEPLDRVTVDVCDGYVADYTAAHHICALVKGVRCEEDLTYEFAQAEYNRTHNPSVDTILLPPEPHLSAISSTAVRDKLSMGESVESLIPKETFALLQRFWMENTGLSVK